MWFKLCCKAYSMINIIKAIPFQSLSIPFVMTFWNCCKLWCFLANVWALWVRKSISTNNYAWPWTWAPRGSFIMLWCYSFGLDTKCHGINFQFYFSIFFGASIIGVLILKKIKFSYPKNFSILNILKYLCFLSTSLLEELRLFRKECWFQFM